MLYEKLSHIGRHRLFSQERFRMQCVKAIVTTEVGDHVLNEQVILSSSSVATSAILLPTACLDTITSVHLTLSVKEFLGNQIYHERTLNRKSDLLHSYAHLSAVVKKPKIRN